ncbi:MAG: YwiC-like family protein [Acidobacteriota bacterium]|nr:YwiC-like family protein [Acidobacteriota bacterium]
MTSPRPRLLPPEHGSWAFLLLPTISALILRPGLPAFSLLMAGLAGFLGRVPLRRTVRGGALSSFDGGWLAFYGLMASTGLFLALRGPHLDFLWALAPVAPFGAWLLWVDLKGSARSLVAEWISIALPALLGAAMIRAGDGPWSLAGALAVGCFLSLAAPVAYLRARLALRRGGKASLRAALWVHGVAGLIALAMQLALGLRWLWPLWMGMLLLRVLLEPKLEQAALDAKALGLRESLVTTISALVLVISLKGL